MPVEVWGMNHRTAPVAVRERMAVAAGCITQELAAMRDGGPCAENVILSTCNRFEVYAVRANGLGRFMEQRHGFAAGELAQYLYHYRGREAVRHLFRVVTGLDSMVLGEAQIAGQVREAYRAAAAAGHAGPVLRGIFEASFRAGAEARRRTRIGAGALSVSSIAVRLALEVFGSLEERRVLVVGAGATGETTVRHLVSRGIGPVIVANRTLERARELAARFRGTAVGFDRLAETLAGVDLVISSTNAPHPVVRAGEVARAMRGRVLPLLFIDIAVPRDVEPAVGELPRVHLYNIDDLDRMREANMLGRRAAATAAERIIEEKVAEVIASEFWRSIPRETPCAAVSALCGEW
jgi:glutamyl-tRNA reductase